MLINKGLEVPVTAADRNELIELYNCLREHIDIFLMDLRMHNLNGIDTTKEIIKNRPGARGVILSSEIEPFYINQTRKAGAIAFLHKIWRILSNWELIGIGNGMERRQLILVMNRISRYPKYMLNSNGRLPHYHDLILHLNTPKTSFSSVQRLVFPFKHSPSYACI